MRRNTEIEALENSASLNIYHLALALESDVAPVKKDCLQVC